MRRTVQLLLGALILAVVPTTAAAQERLITYVARACPSYTDVSANLARNNIQESLRDLGPNTDYVNGEPISPSKEGPGQPNCRPLVGWHFHLGDAIAGQVKGTWGALSVVADPYDTSVVTQAATPMLNDNGDETGYSLPGAVTVPLTDDEYQRSTQGAALWVQGGDVDDPVMDRPYPQRYGFAALRCAIDNYNGDNVESINYPQGARHVYCYAYYVEPPPTSGTIIVQKNVDDPSVTTAQPFTFQGNISYTVDHTFTDNAASGRPGSTTFYRGATGPNDEPWTFAEQVPPGWSLTGLTCDSVTRTSTITTDLATAATSVRLGAGDTVTCIYTDRPIPPAANLLIGKRTIDGVGTFPFTITGPGGIARQSITTRSPGVVATGAQLTGRAGTYAIAERLPATTAAGRWTRVGAACGSRVFGPDTPVRVTLAAGQGAGCVFTNTFIPSGRLTLHKAAIGNTGTANFRIGSQLRAGLQYNQRAKVARQGVPFPATGDATDHLPLGTYNVTETDAAPKPGGHWNLVAAICDGRPVGASQGRIQVRLTARDPRRSCTFIDQFVRRPEPPNPNPPKPDPDDPTPAPAPNPPGTDPPAAAVDAASGPDADLAITKRVVPSTARPGQPVTYTVTVTNRGPDIAYDVFVAELRAPGTRRLRLHVTPNGSCVGDRPARCSIGTLAVGATATITATVTAQGPGIAVNRVGVASSVGDPNMDNNTASAALVVRAPAAAGGGGTAPAVTG
ncbi:DUF11 domain-containing protein [Conexibacter woesei]|uniref:DUF11 domain-containing protein n=1 Tax=Conexibacter woesei TaxID=191495 RepID=UPI00040D599B|nr:DUF11 domain-containing protein [Conexibacter woesei]